MNINCLVELFVIDVRSWNPRQLQRNRKRHSLIQSNWEHFWCTTSERVNQFMGFSITKYKMVSKCSLPVKSAGDTLNCLMLDKYFVCALNFANLFNAFTPTDDDTRIT